jgi:hypothetical protein
MERVQTRANLGADPIVPAGEVVNDTTAADHPGHRPSSITGKLFTIVARSRSIAWSR